MARLIDADALKTAFDDLECIPRSRKETAMAYAKGCNDILHDIAKQVIDDAATVDAVPVVHGEWIWDGKKRAKCSICGEGIGCKSEMMFTLAQEKEHFCYNCGAKMDGDGWRER